MTSRLPADDFDDALAFGEAAGGAHRSFRSLPLADPRLRRAWLQGWMNAVFGGATHRYAANAAELKTNYLAVFHAEQPARGAPIDADAWELVETARHLHPPLPWEVLGAILGRSGATVSVSAYRRHKLRRAA
jgi:ribosome modulation factor